MNCYGEIERFMHVFSLACIVAAQFLVISPSEPLPDRPCLRNTVVLAVMVATMTIGCALIPFSTLRLMACLMLGGIVASSRSSTVISFSSTSPPRSG